MNKFLRFYQENEKTTTELFIFHVLQTFGFYRNYGTQLSVTVKCREISIQSGPLASEALVLITQLCCFGHVKQGDEWGRPSAHGQETEDRKRKGPGGAKYILNPVNFAQILGYILKTSSTEATFLHFQLIAAMTVETKFQYDLNCLEILIFLILLFQIFLRRFLWMCGAHVIKETDFKRENQPTCFFTPASPQFKVILSHFFLENIRNYTSHHTFLLKFYVKNYII